MSHNTPTELRYTKEHEWIKLDGDIAIIGITDFAQSSLGDIVFVELPEVESSLDKDATFGVVESIKSVSDLFSPLKGVITETNTILEDEPELLNTAVYDSWMIKMKMDNTSDYDSLLSAEAYIEFCNSQA